MKHRRLTIWTTAHFAVDFGCFLVLFGSLKPAYAGTGTAGLQTVTLGFLLYNIVAFGLQAAIGQLCDENLKWRRWAGRGGILLPCDGGAIWLKRGTPFSQNMGDESDDMVKRKYLNLVVEFLTAN